VHENNQGITAREWFLKNQASGKKTILISGSLAKTFLCIKHSPSMTEPLNAGLRGKRQLPLI
jgi:hypothetical protein